MQTEIIMGMGSLEFSGLGWVGIYLHSPAHRFHWEWEPKKENKINRDEEKEKRKKSMNECEY